MNNEIIFIPLGGGQRVGASCYYLRIGDANVILDAGTGIENGIEFTPDFHFLISSPFMQSMGQINQIFISHAHMDHVGYLFQDFIFRTNGRIAEEMRVISSRYL